MRAGTLAALPKPPKRDPDQILLPRHLDAERSCLGAALVHNAAADYISDHLTADAFFSRAHGQIFDAIKLIRDQGREVDFITLRTELDRVKLLDQVGGPAYISGLADGVPRATNVQYYAGILKDLQTKRNLIEFAHRTVDLVAAGEHGAAQILADADRRLLELQGGHVEGRMRSIASRTSERFEALEWRQQHRGQLRGLHTGFKGINEMTLGWRRGDLIIIAARPSIGKTALLLNSFVHGAQTQRADGSPTRLAIFSLEMRLEQLEGRMLAQLSGVDFTRIESGYLVDADWGKMSHALEAMSQLKIEIDDRAGQSALDIRAACRRLKGEGGLDAVAIDYVQLMPGTLERKGANRNEEITDISRRLKDLADELSAPVLLLSQLRRTEGRPRLDDLRESGSLEQACDVALLLHRKDHRVSGPTECNIAKQRNGPTGTIHLTFDRETQTITDLDEPVPQESAEEQQQEQQATKRRNQKAFWARRGRSS